MMSRSNIKSPPSSGESLLQFNSSTQGLNKELLGKLKDVTWVIQVTASKQQNTLTTYGTGYSVSRHGFIMTCAHIATNVQRSEIHVRRLNEDGFRYKATIVFQRSKWDLMLLRIDGVDDFSMGELAQDGSLSENEQLLHIGHPHNFVGSILVGYVVYPCINGVSVPNDGRTCKTYQSNALTVTPRYRVLGDLLNAVLFNKDAVDPLVKVIPSTYAHVSVGYEKNLHPLISVIQCAGLVAGPGCSGGPIFNTEGKIVGMLVMSFGGYEIAIHVTVLKKFFEDALKEIGESSHIDVKDQKRKRHSNPIL